MCHDYGMPLQIEFVQGQTTAMMLQTFYVFASLSKKINCYFKLQVSMRRKERKKTLKYNSIILKDE